MKYTSFKEELTDSGHQICRQASLGRTGIQTKTPPVLLLTSCSHWYCTASPPSPSSWYYNHARSAFPQHQAASLTSFYACFRALWSSSILCVSVTASREWNPCFCSLFSPDPSCSMHSSHLIHQEPLLWETCAAQHSKKSN